MSSSHSGTIGRKRVGSGSAASSEYYFAAGGGGEQMRRQRSAEWHSHRHGHGYGSSSEDEYQNTAQATAFDTQLLAQLLLQSQQLASMEHYNSDCEPDYLRQRNAIQRRHGDINPEVTYAQPHQQPTAIHSPLKLATVSASTASKYHSNANLGLFPNSSSSSGTLTATAAAPHANTASTPRSTNPFLSAKYAEDGLTLDVAAPNANAYLLPASASSSTAASSSRSHRSGGATRNTLNRLSGMTSSSSGASALSVNRSDSLREKQQTATALAAATQLKQLQLHELHELDSAGELECGPSDLDDFVGSGAESEPPPEPAPPEIPPRTQSLLMSLRKHSDYKLKYEEKGDQKHEEFIPTSQLQKDLSDNMAQYGKLGYTKVLKENYTFPKQ